MLEIVDNNIAWYIGRFDATVRPPCHRCNSKIKGIQFFVVVFAILLFCILYIYFLLCFVFFCSFFCAFSLSLILATEFNYAENIFVCIY